MKAVIPALLLVAACQREPVDSAASTGGGGPCDAAPVQALVGRPADQVLLDATRLSGAKTGRVYKSGSPVTMDYRPDRINLEVNDKNVIVKVSCG